MHLRLIIRTFSIATAVLAAACTAWPQETLSMGPKVGIIDFYGARKVSDDRLRKALGMAEGDPLPTSKSALEDRLEQVPGIIRAQLMATCCEAGKAILYVGIEEKGAPHFEYHGDPQSAIALSDEMHVVYAQFLRAAEVAGRAGDVAEDLTNGHSLFANPDVRAAQERFLELAEKNLDTIRKVLRESADDEQRAIAAYLIQYAPDKAKVVNDLQYALQDPDETVRSNAVRSLGALAVMAIKKPDSGLKISPTWFVEMLNSIVWTDRNNAAVVLVNLTEGRDERTLALLKERALPALVEMARWRHLPHALPAYILVGRVAGLPEQEVQDQWSAGKRETVIQKALGNKKK